MGGSAGQGPRRSLLFWVRIVLGVGGLVALIVIVRSVGLEVLIQTLRPALSYLPLLCALELGRYASEAVGAYLALGSRASLIPKATLFRANLIGASIANLAPAPRLVNETIKATLIAPYVGASVATSVGVTIQAATLLSVGLFSLPCALAVLFMAGVSFWFWAIVIHGVALVAVGLALRAATRAKGPLTWLAARFPRLAPGAEAFTEHSTEVGLWAVGPTAALMGNRGFQALQLGVASAAVGIDAGIVQGLAAQGVHLVANAVGVLVPAGLGTTDGAFTLAADLFSTDTARATSVALLMRITQLIWLGVGSIVLFVGTKRA
ncbi:MAG: flippase-like domain-containing protein [Polyangiaceae bacterium]|nr:flippase-like domain-containing protein [Polyangiaceae bacterium]